MKKLHIWLMYVVILFGLYGMMFSCFLLYPLSLLGRISYSNEYTLPDKSHVNKNETIRLEVDIQYYSHHSSAYVRNSLIY